MKWSVATLFDATGGVLLQGPSDRPLGDISTDTRTIAPGGVFVALRGDNFDGYTFVSQAVAAGAAALIVSRSDAAVALDPTIVVIKVADTLRALGDLARYQRGCFTLPVAGITGSNGKTSTKEMIATILGMDRKVLRNPGNFNNLVGVPLTIFRLDDCHRAAVIEMGVNMVGEMAQLVRISAPTIGLITNIQPAHLEGLGSEETVLREKGLLWRSLGPGGLAVVNLDDQRLVALARELPQRIVSYSLTNPAADVHLSGAIEPSAGGARFRLAIGGTRHPVHLPVIGRHQAQNAVAAAALAHGMGVAPDRIVAGLAQHRPVSQRMDTIRLEDGTVIVDDTYNANPRSTIAALQAVKEVSGGRPFLAVLGEMLELGPDTRDWHRRVGEFAGRLGLTGLITYGDLAREIGNGAVTAGLSQAACRHATSHAEVISLLLDNWSAGAWILIKGSRGAGMEQVVQGIRAA